METGRRRDGGRSEAGRGASVTGGPSPGGRRYVQADLARAEGKLAGARAFFYDTIEAGWDELLTTGDTAPQTRINLRLAATTACLVYPSPTPRDRPRSRIPPSPV